MEPSFGNSSSTNPHRSNFLYPPRTSSTSSTHEHGSASHIRVGDPLSRGHSDGDMLSGSHKTRIDAHREPASAGRESWMDFIRESPSSRQDTLNRAQLAASRAAIMASDRRKRIAEHHEDYVRRRSSSSLSFGQPAGDRSWQSFLQVGNGRTFDGPSDSSSTQSIMDHSLPRRPSIESMQNRRSRETTLPRWQPDAEVSKCPICGTAFTMWYRRHHCRKCGRVVCANCSPHRITIPRQFIVHPPEDAAHSPTTTTNPTAQMIDLTGNADDTADGAHTHDRPQSSDYRIDPALGGGQEVRLCNPCVPDPNPLPHLPYPSPPALPTFNSLPRPERISSYHDHPSLADLTNPRDVQLPSLTRRVSGRSEYLQHDGSGFDPSLASAASRASPRRHSHAPHPIGPQLSPPGYSSLFGSAPDQTAHQRHLQALLQQNHTSHHHHRHHASMGNIPGPSRYRPIPSLDATTPRAILRLEIREEDECPICHQELPPKGPDGSEGAREAHISSCVESHFSTSTPGTRLPLASAATDATVAASAAAPAQASGPRPIPTGQRESTASSDPPSASFQQRRRAAGMLVYHASEKDCVGEDGQGGQECVICFEEFAVGDEMGRLECLCKFHKACIRQWFDTKGQGACPVHQEGT